MQHSRLNLDSKIVDKIRHLLSMPNDSEYLIWRTYDNDKGVSCIINKTLIVTLFKLRTFGWNTALDVNLDGECFSISLVRHELRWCGFFRRRVESEEYDLLDLFLKKRDSLIAKKAEDIYTKISNALDTSLTIN